MSDLLERLRSEAVNWSATCGDLFGEAADEIERLRGENLRLARELARAEDEIERLKYKYGEKG